jgi:hypothetical protein
LISRTRKAFLPTSQVGPSSKGSFFWSKIFSSKSGTKFDFDERFDLAGAGGQGYESLGGSLADAFLKNKGKLREKLDQRVHEDEPNVEKKVRKNLEAPIDKVRLAQLRKEMRKKPHLPNLNVDRDTATEYSAPAHGYSNNNLKALTNIGPRTPKSMGLTSVMGSTSNLTAKEPNPE